LTCRVDVSGWNPRFRVRSCNDGARVATIVEPLASLLGGARRAPILSGNIIGQPSSRGSATHFGRHRANLKWGMVDGP
jgi:hypothetical protein